MATGPRSEPIPAPNMELDGPIVRDAPAPSEATLQQLFPLLERGVEALLRAAETAGAVPDTPAHLLRAARGEEASLSADGRLEAGRGHHHYVDEVARARPPAFDPVRFLAQYLMRHNPAPPRPAAGRSK